MTFDDLVAAFLSQFDSDSATAERIANMRHARMVAEALYRSVEKSLGTTVAGQDRYAVATDVVDLKRVYVDDTTRYDPVSLDDFRSLLDPDDPAALVGTGGVFAPAYLDDGTLQIRLYPTPDETGLEIVGIEVLEPVTMTLAHSPVYSPIVPVDLHGFLYDGMLADGYAQIDERPDLSSYHEQRFELGVQKLARRKTGLIGGGARGMNVRVG